MSLFLGIGAQKAGTTWLFHQLRRHPDVHFPRGKELHYWNRAELPDATEWRSLLAIDGGNKRAVGEITPAYFHLPPTRIALIHRAFPDLRIFVSLRNPITRAWSAALMDLARLSRRVADTDDDWFVENVLSATSLARGSYTANLERWWSLFSRKQLFVSLFEDIEHQPAVLLTELAAHLGLDAACYRQVDTELLQQVVIPRFTAGGRPLETEICSVRPAIGALLAHCYRDEIARLSSILEQDLTGWLDEETWSAPRAIGTRVKVDFGAD